MTWRSPFAFLVCATAILALVALVNGYPLVFPDTGTYLRQAIELRGVIDRPPYYSLFLLPLHLKVTLWAIPVVQDLLVCWILFRFLQLMFPALRAIHALAIVVALTLFSALPWVSNEIMPDIFVPLIVLVCFMLVWFFDRLARIERVVLALALAAMTSFHQANTLLVGLLIVAAAAIGMARRRPATWFARLTVPVVALVCAVAAQALYGYLVIGRVTPSPSGPFFLLARVTADGPGRRYLDSVCPTAGFRLCAMRDRLSDDANWLMWDDASPIAELIAKDGWLPARDEAAAIVAGTLRDRPWDALVAGLQNGVRQFVEFAPTSSCPCVRDRLLDMITRYFPRELPAFRSSLQNTGRLPWDIVSAVDLAAVLLGGAVLVVGFVRRQPRGFPCPDFLGFLVAALLVNALIMGALSGPENRYQARLIWLVPFAALAYGMSLVGTGRREG